MHACTLFLSSAEMLSLRNVKQFFFPITEQKDANLIFESCLSCHCWRKNSQLLIRFPLQTIVAGTGKLDGTNEAETTAGCVLIPGVGAFTVLDARCSVSSISDKLCLLSVFVFFRRLIRQSIRWNQRQLLRSVSFARWQDFAAKVRFRSG